MDTFKEKLKIGDAVAELFAESQRRKGKKVEVSIGFDRDKDLTINGKLVELKADFIAQETGNLCVEKRSLETHTAPIIIYGLVFFVDKIIISFYWCYRKDLLEWYPKAQDKRKIGDDGREGAMLIISSPQFDEIFKKI